MSAFEGALDRGSLEGLDWEPTDRYYVMSDDHDYALAYVRSFKINPGLPELRYYSQPEQFAGLGRGIPILKVSLTEIHTAWFNAMQNSGHFREWSRFDFTYLKALTSLG